MDFLTVVKKMFAGRLVKYDNLPVIFAAGQGILAATDKKMVVYTAAPDTVGLPLTQLSIPTNLNYVDTFLMVDGVYTAVDPDGDVLVDTYKPVSDTDFVAYATGLSMIDKLKANVVPLKQKTVFACFLGKVDFRLIDIGDNKIHIEKNGKFMTSVKKQPDGSKLSLPREVPFVLPDSLPEYGYVSGTYAPLHFIKKDCSSLVIDHKRGVILASVADGELAEATTIITTMHQNKGEQTVNEIKVEATVPTVIVAEEPVAVDGPLEKAAKEAASRAMVAEVLANTAAQPAVVATTTPIVVEPVIVAENPVSEQPVITVATEEKATTVTLGINTEEISAILHAKDTNPPAELGDPGVVLIETPTKMKMDLGTLPVPNNEVDIKVVVDPSPLLNATPEAGTISAGSSVNMISNETPDTPDYTKAAVPTDTELLAAMMSEYAVKDTQALLRNEVIKLDKIIKLQAKIIRKGGGAKLDKLKEENAQLKKENRELSELRNKLKSALGL